MADALHDLVVPCIRNAEMLLVLPVPFKEEQGRLLMESQAHHGLERWLDTFSSLIVAAPVWRGEKSEFVPAMVWTPCDDLRKRVDFVPLPWAYTIPAFFRHYAQTCRLLLKCIEHAQFLQFAIHGLIGDWASVAAQIAIRRGRSFSVHTDNVAHEYIVRIARGWRKQIQNRVFAAVMKKWHEEILYRTDLALCHGSDCLAAYGAWARSSALVHNVHDVHLATSSEFTAADADGKAQEVLRRERLRVCYAGRMVSEKAPLHWVRAIHRAVTRGAALDAVWLGDGPLRGEVEAEIERLGLKQIVTLAGFVADQARVQQEIRRADVMLFTHVTPESPRCLIESLRAAAPIVGYGSAYSDDLIHEHGGGALTHGEYNPAALGDLLSALASDRPRLAALIRRAWRDGAQYTSAGVFKHRGELIHRFVTPGPITPAPRV